MFQKKGVGTRRLKYRLPENPGILNSPHTSVRGNGLVASLKSSFDFEQWKKRSQRGREIVIDVRSRSVCHS